MKNGKDHGEVNEGAAAPKRFYDNVEAVEEEGEGWRILLDGRGVKTPLRADLILPSEALAEAIAEEWRAQKARIDPESMPLTKLANTALDGVAPNAASVAEDVLGFAGRDLICYRADGPLELVLRQKAHWDPLIAWAEEYYGAKLIVAEGVMPVEQPADSLAALRTACLWHEPFSLTALHVITTLTGSAIIALAHIAGRLSLEASWTAAHVDEDFQREQWGEDAEADARREIRLAEMRAASRFFELSKQS
jgi:chaperone required for assembly of F1-ATPase